MENKEGTKITVEQAGIVVTAEIPLGVAVHELLDIFKQVTVGLGFADYGQLYFSKMEEEDNV